MSESDKQFLLTSKERLVFQQLQQLKLWEERGAKTDAIGLAATNSEGRMPERWDLLGEVRLREWQTEAANRWIGAGGRGIAKVVTGAGKTVLALAAIEKLQHGPCPDLRVVVVVPTVVLVQQWVETLHRSNLPKSAIKTLGGGEVGGFDEETRIIVAVLNSAAARLPDIVRATAVGDRLLIVVDECHRAGSTERRKLFQTERAFTLGLSATPERDDAAEFADFDVNDGESEEPIVSSGDEVLAAEIGPVIFELSYVQAVQAGILPHFRVEHYGLSLSDHERKKYDELSAEISDLRRDLESGTRRGIALFRWCRSGAGQKDARAQRFLSLTSERKFLLYRMRARFDAIAEIVDRAVSEYSETKIIIFHESIEDVMSIFMRLRDCGHAVVAEHSLFPDRIRAESIRLFRDGVARIIVSAKSLIEGFNVPSAELGIIAAASSSVRQRVQTLGRLLRNDPARRKEARLIVLYATDTVDEVIYERADWEKLIGAERNEYFVSKLDGLSKAQHVEGPPRRPKPTEDEINVESLRVGEDYPGNDDGDLYSVDTQGNIFDQAGRMLRATDSLQAVIESSIKGGGRFTVSPLRHHVTKLHRDGANLRRVYLGTVPGTLFEANLDLSDGDVKGGDPPYVLPVGKTKRYSVLQRDPRLVAEKQGGKVRFVVPPEEIHDPIKSNRLRKIIDRLHGIYGSGRRINKVFVTATGDVLYSFGGHYFFVGEAPEGADGFVFEDSGQ